ncbi:bifunctional hydroxymethylpyrimidine kinase/phosphomethylpyrimidine kinase, partial [Staphylococcus epidermidis]|uniref:bifunctional hydroxymethylpyrimidine kinase/phosphomethylpyrimidine kinase n=1 Tax=Staphylococcus epidermidis TaxID=1282 RepID=UPI001642731D
HFLFTNNQTYTFHNKPFHTKHTHPTPSTFSPLITPQLPKAPSIKHPVKKPKHFISLTIQHTPQIPNPRPPLNHFPYINKLPLHHQ